MDAVAPHASLAPLVHKHFEIQVVAADHSGLQKMCESPTPRNK
jgi:hypothetical protein